MRTAGVGQWMRGQGGVLDVACRAGPPGACLSAAARQRRARPAPALSLQMPRMLPGHFHFFLSHAWLPVPAIPA